MKDSTYKVVFEFEGGVKVHGEFSRIYAPITVSRLVSSLPLNGRVEALKGWLYFTVDISLRPEKPKFNCEPRWIGYWPLAKAICLFYEKTSLKSPVNRIGSISDSDFALTRIPSGVRVRIRPV
ncbi:MAG: cyclophilin-like family protein [Candidatus Bathyarchaeia archaeon]